MENFNQIIEQIKPAMEQMAQQLGLASEFLWEVLIKQQFIEGITYSIWSVVGLLFLFASVIGGYKITKKIYKSNLCEDAILAPITVGIILAIIGFIMFGTNISEAIYHLLNPEYQALKDIFEFIKGNIQ